MDEQDDAHGPGPAETLEVTRRERGWLIDGMMVLMHQMRQVQQNDLSEMPEVQALLEQLMAPEPLTQRRYELLERIGETWRGDWTGSRFDGRDGRDWINTALYGDEGLLSDLEQKLDRLDALA